MIREVAAKRYAEAAFEIARGQGQLEEWSVALGLMARVLGDPEVVAVMESARVAASDKLRLVERTLEGIEPLALNLARLLVARGRSGLAPQVAEAFQELVDEERGIAHALVTAAVPLTDGEKRAVVDKLGEVTGKQVLLEAQVDDGIIGGLVARVGDRLIDGSTRSKLLALKRQLQEARA
ncbi:MAG: ATP synthase F1 subunit delta [Chloroflexi bacterium]|nr:ATP synthase F1 subunit delta [Chloroflexota bacterium]